MASPRSSVSPDFGHWLAGFVAGEGCFYISGYGPPSRRAYQCGFHLQVRDDEAAIIKAIAARTGIGRVIHSPARKRTKPQVAWRAHSRDDCLAVADLFSRFPLRGKKEADFLIWRTAVGLWTEVKGGPGWLRNEGTWRDMATLYDALKAGRAYPATSSM